ncbi:DEKNAAC103431 [Brettanomyces naardenensis]|uniref:DEKNAAC103431 n=1 Tax=Brettanomyces naardenensis TaxID=13370 RepID=A0A448YN91_BRENA|nr:DEKNAAC103431 [Brettanomyces naardenensis]
MSTILVDRLMASGGLTELNDHALIALSQQPNDKATRHLLNIFEDLYASLKPFFRLYSKRSHLINNHDVTFDSIDPVAQITAKTIDSVVHALQQVSESDGIYDTPESSHLVDLILVFSLLAILLHTGQHLLDNTLPLSDDIDYFDRVLNSPVYTTIYMTQTLPETTVHLTVYLFNCIAQKHDHPETSAAPEWLPQSLHFLYFQYMKWLYPIPRVIADNVSQFIHSPSTYFISTQRRSGLLARSVIASSIGLPYFYSVSQLKVKRKNLSALRDQNVQRIGYLIDELLPELSTDSLENPDYSSLSKLGLLYSPEFPSGAGAPIAGSSRLAVQALHDIAVKQLPAFTTNLNGQIRANRQPSLLTKYWIVGLLGVAYVPGIITDIVTNRTEIYQWIQTNLVDTVVRFWQNWVLQPLQNVLKTIRHDDDSRIAVMSKQSLNSDLESLERMVVEYCVDNYSYLNTDGVDADALIEQIRQQVKAGDIEMVMKIYEDNLKAPVRSLVSGSMIRNLLIQIQKTKVDGDVALSGIDKILQSQELVFGLVAASPACFVVWYLIITANSYFHNGYVVRFSREHKRNLVRSMTTLERLVDIQVHEATTKEEDKLSQNGLMYLELINLRRHGIAILPAYLRSDWIRDLNDVMGSRNGGFRLATIQRIWNGYGVYFTN